MKNQRILFGSAWIVSVVAAYFIGTSGDSAKPTSGSTGGGDKSSSAKNSATETKTDRAMVRKMDELEELGKDGKPNIALLIAKARQQFGGGGMGGMMNIRQMLRAIAPIAELDDSQIQEALSEVERTVREPQQKMMFYSLLLGQWAESDGKAALAYAEDKLGQASPFDMGVRASVLSSWARRDPDAAWRWFQTERKDDGNERNKGMSINMIFAGMASNNLDSAFQKLSTLDDATRAMALSGIAGSASDDLSRRRLLDRAASLPTEQRTQINQSIVSQWAMSDSDAAVKWIHSLPADEQKPLRDSAGNMIMMMKPAIGADLLMENAEEKDKPQLYDRIAGQWAFQDPRAAGEWLMKQPQGPELDNARRSYAMAVAQKDPAAAMDWAKSVQKEDQRAQSVEQVYNQWRMKDANAAGAALDTAGLPADKVKQLKEAPLPPKSATNVGSVRRAGF